MYVPTRFSIRSWLAATAVTAAAIAVLQSRPTESLVVDVVVRTVLIDGQCVPSDQLAGVLKRKAWHRKVWMMEPGMIIQPCDITPHEKLTSLIEASQSAGFETFEFRNVDPGIEITSR